MSSNLSVAYGRERQRRVGLHSRYVGVCSERQRRSWSSRMNSGVQDVGDREFINVDRV